MYSYHLTSWPYQTYPYSYSHPYISYPWTTGQHYYPTSAIQHPWTMPPAAWNSGGHLSGGLDPATSYMFPAEHTKIKCFTGAAWTPGTTSAHGQRFAYYTVPLNLTINELIARAGGGDKWILTELYEQGGGDFAKGMEIQQGTDDAKQTLKGCGFSRDNVCVWIHKS